ncbi:MAG: tyrosine-type recombinase/integrase [Lachnospiraceae bacterium]|nr:tyrosine-type recombinase/integrase [Lachnospiraceae bacterium]
MKYKQLKKLNVEILNKLLVDYIEYKQATGVKYDSEYKSIKYFIKYCKSIYKDSTIDENAIFEWINSFLNTSLKTKCNYIGALRGFAVYLYSLGYIQFNIPNVRTPRSTAFMPYIFNDAELNKIWEIVDNIKEYKHFPNLNKCIPVFFRLLYSSGLRVTEALSIVKKDIDFEKNVILLKKTKLSKERYIPLSKSMSKILKKYVDMLNVSSSDYIFYFVKGTKLTRDDIYRRFKMALKSAQIHYKGKLNGPRVHDFRHTFSVKSMDCMVDSGVDIYVSLPILSAYLGHTNVKSTEKYIRMTKERMHIVTESMESVLNNILPEVKTYEEI